MKVVQYAVFLLLLSVSILSEAQTITFHYDDAGNRTERVIGFKKSNEVMADSTSIPAPITDKLDEMTISIYPNPTQGKLVVDISNMPIDVASQITMHNLEGKIMQNIQSVQPSNQFDLSYYPTGIYVMQIKVGAKVQEWKIIRE